MTLSKIVGAGICMAGLSIGGTAFAQGFDGAGLFTLPSSRFPSPPTRMTPRHASPVVRFAMRTLETVVSDGRDGAYVLPSAFDHGAGLSLTTRFCGVGCTDQPPFDRTLAQSFAPKGTVSDATRAIASAVEQPPTTGAPGMNATVSEARAAQSKIPEQEESKPKPLYPDGKEP